MTADRPRPGEGRVLGVDVGQRRVGVAMSDETRTVATPLTTLDRSASDMWRRIDGHIRHGDVAVVVVGLPRRLDGSEGDAAAAARTFGGQLERRTGVAVEMWDERFTTVQAERALIDAGMRRVRRRRTVDAIAAALLLQNWLDAHHRHR